MKKEIYTAQYYLNLGCSLYQAKRRANIIAKWDGKQELSDGMIYKEMRNLGINHILSFNIETTAWIEYDKLVPPTPYEKGLIKYIEGTGKLKYNQIPLV